MLKWRVPLRLDSEETIVGFQVCRILMNIAYRHSILTCHQQSQVVQVIPHDAYFYRETSKILCLLMKIRITHVFP